MSSEAAAAMPVAVVKLDDLNAKQLAKEYKATQKDLRQKDAVVKTAAIEKIKADSRYYTAGGALVPLLNSITTKKKLFDLSKQACETVSQFIQFDLALTDDAGTNRIEKGVIYLA